MHTQVRIKGALVVIKSGPRHPGPRDYEKPPEGIEFDTFRHGVQHTNNALFHKTNKTLYFSPLLQKPDKFYTLIYLHTHLFTH